MTFTAGRGSHHLIAGGAVKGQKTYGKFPTLAVNGPDDTSTGRWIPTTATDQYFATLATWFGVDGSNLSTVFSEPWPHRSLGLPTPAAFAKNQGEQGSGSSRATPSLHRNLDETDKPKTPETVSSNVE